MSSNYNCAENEYLRAGQEAPEPDAGMSPASRQRIRKLMDDWETEEEDEMQDSSFHM